MVLASSLASAGADVISSSNLLESNDIYTLPTIQQAPNIDGELTEGEYASAGAMTGFAMLDGSLSPRQTHVWYCHDKDNIYVAFSTLFESQGPPALGKAGILEMNDIGDCDFFELWISTSETRRQYVVNMNQGLFSYDHMKRAPADNTTVFKGTFTSNPFLVGGKWQGEFAIPKSKLPGWDKGISLLFCRDFSANGQGRRSESDWTSSTPMRGDFSQSDFHPKARLSDRQEHVAITGFGEWSIGEAVVHGRLDGFSHPVSISWRLFDDKSNTIREFSQSASDGEFIVGERLNTDTPVKGTAYLQIADSENGEIIHAQHVVFSCGSPMRFHCLPIIGNAELSIGFDTRDIPPLPAGTLAEVTIISGNKTLQRHEFPLEEKPQAYEFHIDASKFSYQGYRVECRLKHDERELFLAAEPDVWLGTPPWSRTGDEALGIPVPWLPLRTDSNRVEMLERTYTLTDSGLPAAVTSLGRELLQKTAELTLSANGKAVPIVFEPIALISGSDEQLTYAIKGQSADMQVDGTLTIDYDGFARWQTTFTAKADITLNFLAISWSMPAERALYARGNVIGGLPGGYSANLDLPSNSPKPAEFIATTIHSYTGWQWNTMFFYNFMMGDDETGLSFMTESDRFHNGSEHIAVISENNVRNARLTLTSQHALKAGETLRYDYAWCALPLKTPPNNPLHFHQGYAATRDIDISLMDLDDDFFHLVPLVVGAWFMRHESYWQLEERESAKRRVPNIMSMHAGDFFPGLKRALDAGCQVITEGIFFAAMNTALAETQRHQAEWKVMPGGYSWPNFEEAMNLAACPNSSWRDFIETVCRRVLDETPLQGVYLDVATEQPCNNALHGCGYDDGQGIRRPTVNLWGTRELHKRVYAYYHTKGRNGKTLHHALNNAAWAGFCDAGLQGEEWSIYKDYEKMTPDFFRAMKMTQYGTPYTFFAMFLYWQSGNLAEVMAICLPHKVYPAIWAYRKDNYPEIKPYWAVMDPWWCDSEFVGYWHQTPPTDAPRSKGILASAFIKQGKALLTVANWQYQDARVPLRFNHNLLTSNIIRAQDALSGETIHVNGDNSISVFIPKRNVLLIELEFE